MAYLNAEVGPPIDEVVELGVLPRFVQMLAPKTEPKLQVANTHAHTQTHTHAYTRAHAHTHTHTLWCGVPHPLPQFEACWVVTNVASGSREQTQTVVDAGAVPALVLLVDSPHENIQEQVRGGEGEREERASV